MSTWQDPATLPRKRKRVTRACDECRKKKVKCDGQMPCIHCQVYSYDCTFDQPSSRRKVPDLKVEQKLKTAEAVVDALLPGVDIYSPMFELQNAVPNARLSQSPDFSSPQSADGTEFKIILPQKHIAIQLIESVWENACVLFRFYHRPSFIRDLDLLYETEPDVYSDKQYKILPLMYSVLAVGALFNKQVAKDDDGYRYFTAARRLIDITDAKDLYSIQSIVMMVIFLQCSAKLSTCYSYIGLALRAAMRAGLHRRIPCNDPIELETRKRLFWTIRKMDIYVNSVLGLPRGIAEEDFDQDMPAEIDDENITEDAYFAQQEGKLSSMGISNAHTRIMTVLSHITQKIYPVNEEATFAHVELLEQEIASWYDSLPLILQPGAQVPMEYFKANRLLSLTYCYVQIMLYRPFIHTQGPYSQKCVNVARTAIYYANELVAQNMLNGAYWFSVYTLFFSVACLVYTVHEKSNSDPQYAQELRNDAELGKNVLNQLREGSVAASRTHSILNSLFDQLNKRIGQPNDGVSVAQLSLKSESNPSSELLESIPQISYEPGLMDQVDQQLFGRFLPPYMTEPPEERRVSLSDLFGSKEWDNFLSSHTELSGVNPY